MKKKNDDCAEEKDAHGLGFFFVFCFFSFVFYFLCGLFEGENFALFLTLEASNGLLVNVNHLIFMSL